MRPTSAPCGRSAAGARILAQLSFVLALLAVLPRAHAIERENLTARRLAHLLGYVAADYQNAVQHGAIADRFEYEEQLSLLDTSIGLASEAGFPGIADDVRRLRKAVTTKAPVAEVETTARRLRRQIAGRAHLSQRPDVTPDLARGRALYRQHCAKCHGAAGRADTEEAQRLKPPPVSFTDPAVVEALSPLRVVDTARFGIDGTAMAPFDFLPEHDLWHLGFFVVSLRHTARRSPHTPRMSLGELALRTDRELLDELYEAGATSRELLTFAAELRTSPVADVEPAMAALVSARAGVLTADLLLARGQREHALAAAEQAHFEGLRPAQLALRIVDPRLASELDERFLAWRMRLSTDDDDALQRDARVLATKLTRGQLLLGRFGASPRLGDEPGLGGVPADAPTPAPPFVQFKTTFAATLRALLWLVLSAALTVLLMARHRTYAHGWRIQLPWALGALLGAAATLSTLRWLLVDGSALTLALILTASVATHAPSLPTAKLAAAGSAAAGVTLGAETAGLVQHTGGRGTAALAGVAVATSLLLALATEGVRLHGRLSDTAQSVVTHCTAAVLGAYLAGRGVFALQVAGWLPAHVYGFRGIGALGLHPTAISIGTQLTIAAIGLVALGSLVRRAVTTAAP